MNQPFLPVATEAPHSKTLVGFRRPPQLKEVPFPLVRVLRCPNPRPAAPGDTLELEPEPVRVLGIKLGR